MKAYLATTIYSNFIDVIFADNTNEAKTIATHSGVLDYPEYIDVKVKRVKKLDNHELHMPKIDKYKSYFWEFCGNLEIEEVEDE